MFWNNLQAKEQRVRWLEIQLQSVSPIEEKFKGLLQEYNSLLPQSETAEIYWAKFYEAHGDVGRAIECAERAYEIRRVSSDVWKLLSHLYRKQGNWGKAGLMDGLQSLHAQQKGAIFETKHLSGGVQNVNHSENVNTEEYLQGFSFGISDSRQPPFYMKMVANDSVMSSRLAHFNGEFLPDAYNENSEGYRYWIGAYNAPNGVINARGTHMLSHGNMTDYFNFDFDMTKAKLAKIIKVMPPKEAPIILPIAGTEIRQPVIIKQEGLDTQATLGKSEFNYYRIEKETEIQSPKEFAFGVPIPMIHSRKRKKLVLSILTDGLSWNQMKKENYAHVPHILDFFSKGCIFNNNYANAEHTYPALPCIEMGMEMHQTQIFHPNVWCEISSKYRSISEQMKTLGYYCCNIGQSFGIYNGVLSGHDRHIWNLYHADAYENIEKAIKQIEAFNECDQFVSLYFADTHCIQQPDTHYIPLDVQTHLKLTPRFAYSGKTSVFQGASELSIDTNHRGIADVDRLLHMLFSFIEEHYGEDEYVVMLYSDHGASFYAPKPYLMSDEQVGSALMVRGSGVPSQGLVNELTSNLDIYKILGHLVGYPIDMKYLDGNLPEVFGGKRREYVISSSIFPGQTYKLDIRTDLHEFYLETEESTHQDGTVDMRKYQCHIYTRDVIHREIRDVRLTDYFLRIAAEHTDSFRSPYEFGSYI